MPFNNLLKLTCVSRVLASKCMLLFPNISMGVDFTAVTTYLSVMLFAT